MTTQLSGKHRKQLRGLVHGQRPVVQVGRAGLQPAVVESVAQALRARELIKVRFVAWKEAKRSLAEELACQVEAELVGLVGHQAVLYRPHPDPSRRRIERRLQCGRSTHQEGEG